jgi:hypothetical protein
LQREQVTLSEATFISYFKPVYNVQHKKSFPGKKSSLAFNLDRQGYTNLSVLLSDNDTGVQFWSAERQASRHHQFSCFLTSAAQSIPGDLAITAEETESRLRAVYESAALNIENSPITLAFLPADFPERFNRI